jgi:hypothetical protein
MLVVCVLSILISYGQHNDKVDEKNGFLEFKFGKHPASFGNKIKQVEGYLRNKSSSTYRVVSKDYERVFGYKVKQIELWFYGNKLYAITIDFAEAGDNISFPYVKGQLENIFGSRHSRIIPEDSQYIQLTEGVAWEGRKNKLYIQNLRVKNTGKQFASIFYTDKVLQEQMNALEF